jgi:hypothetical protein
MAFSSDPEAGAGNPGRALAMKRWGNRYPIKIAQELEQRLDELPPAEVERLREAIERHKSGAPA